MFREGSDIDEYLKSIHGTAIPETEAVDLARKIPNNWANILFGKKKFEKLSVPEQQELIRQWYVSMGNRSL